MPLEIASNGEVSYSVTNVDSALTMLMAVYVYGEEAVKDTKQIAFRNTTVLPIFLLLLYAVLSIHFLDLPGSPRASLPGGSAARFDVC
ncbi:hypothetical protein ElyMa_002326700 [Elysia marginata]|uniref:Uncharacterized protein n=1 Tax=Elysia marginata TaxID=1093978 RepID=A0AAV4G7A0_9GAST|nr:hypothetical protein ElyMa_002326700 [Elysia marginata]